MGNRIVLTDVDAGYGAVRVLHRVSIEVDEGKTVALLGTNGNGKSTLMKCIMGSCQWRTARCFWKSTAGYRFTRQTP